MGDEDVMCREMAANIAEREKAQKTADKWVDKNTEEKIRERDSWGENTRHFQAAPPVRG